MLDKQGVKELNRPMQPENHQKSSTLDPEEIARFGAIADEWWDVNGKFRPLHKISPARLTYLREQICRHFARNTKDENALKGLTLLDIGCGGGLVAEPLAKQGAIVTAIDPSINNIEAARLHANGRNVQVDYRACKAEDVIEKGETFDVVLVLEVVEHVPSVADFVAMVSKLLAPGGIIIFSTINRTTKSFALAIIGAEYVLQWLPKGTHQWNRFVSPEELGAMITNTGLTMRDESGLVYSPFKDSWSISGDSDVNYFLSASRDQQ